MQLDEPHKWSVNVESLLGAVRSQRVRRLAKRQCALPLPAQRLTCRLQKVRSWRACVNSAAQGGGQEAPLPRKRRHAIEVLPPRIRHAWYSFPPTASASSAASVPSSAASFPSANGTHWLSGSTWIDISKWAAALM